MRWGVVIGAMLVVGGGVREVYADEAATWTDRVSLLASERVRGEFVDWFAPPAGTAERGAERYRFFASQLRLGIRVALPWVELVVQGQDTRLVGLPDDASLAPPQGNLGTGATYYAYTHDTTQGEPFLKQGYATFRASGFAATLGRFEYRDGLEVIPADPTLAQVKRTRVAERLIGPFDFTHVTRSFDGARLVYDTPDWNATAIAFHPSYGGFEISANRQLTDIDVAGLAATLKQLPVGPPIDIGAFYFYYHDDRDDTVKTDNRPLTTRLGDHHAIAIHTLGARAMTAVACGPGIADVLLWAAFQRGEWGLLDHTAGAVAAEIGYQLPRVPASPWLRVGYDRSSGDDNPDDGHHGTFFQMLPTARIYAQTPFYNLMNSADFFVELLLRPHERVGLRTDWHWITVSDPADLWYSGGGAGNDTIFGYAGAPALGKHELAQLVDVSATVAILPRLTLGMYFGHVFGGAVVGNSYAGRDANYGFAELAFRY